MKLHPHRHGHGHGHNGQKPKQFPTNWGIPGNTVRIVSNGEARLVGKKEAIEEARLQGADLIEFARPDNAPPVCRITEVGKLRYEMEKAHKKEKAQKTKEIGLHPNIGEHDLQTKIRHAKEFLEDHNRIVFRLQFRGRERAHKELGFALLGRISKDLDPWGKFESPNSSGPNMFLRGAPKKTGGNGTAGNGQKEKLSCIGGTNPAQ